MKERPLATGSTLAALLASLCCLGPVLLGGAGLGAVLVATFAPLRPYFLAVSGVLLAGGFFLVFLKTKAAGAWPRGKRLPRSATPPIAQPPLPPASPAVSCPP